MATKTNNYNLIKPSLSDPADITAINSNWDAIDSTMKTIESNATNLKNNINQQIVTLQTKITHGTSAPSGGKSGDVYIQLLD